MYQNSDGDKLIVEDFGTLAEDVRTSSKVKKFTWFTNSMEVQVISYGATIVSIKVPDRKGKRQDVVMGFDTISSYQDSKNPYFGATVGRYANRIRDGKFQLNGVTYELSKNIDRNTLHGGFRGFDKINWNWHVDNFKVVFSCLSNSGEEGFPGDVMTNLTYEVEGTTIKIHIVSMCTSPTPINLTNHSYFNLAGHERGPEELFKHEFIINSSTFTPLDKEMCTTGAIETFEELRGARNEDLKKFTLLHEFMPKAGLDLNFCIDGKESCLNLMAKAHHIRSGRVLELYSNQPGVQFYTSNFLPSEDATKENSIFGKNGCKYVKHGAFCLEPQAYPNSLNHPNFPNTILNPGQKYVHDIVFKFLAY